MKGKKTLFFHHINDYTGSSRVLASLIEEEYGNEEVTVIVWRNHNHGFLSECKNVRIISFWMPHFNGRPIPGITSIAWRITSLVLALWYGWRFDLFYINTIVPYYAAIVGRMYGKDVIFHIHERFLEKGLAYSIVLWVFDHIKSHRIFVSYYIKEQYKDNPKCTWEVKYNRLAKSFTSQIKIRPIEVRQRNRILMIASLTKAKGLFTFMDVAQRLSNLSFRLILSADNTAISNFFKRDISTNVEIMPAQSDVRPFLFEADLMLNLSIPFYGVETFGMTILEAMAYGVPSIVPNVGEPTELIEDGYNGFCVDVTDKDAVAEAIKKALSPGVYDKLAEHSLKRFKEKFA